MSSRRVGIDREAAISLRDFRAEAAQCRLLAGRAIELRDREQLLILADHYDREADSQQRCASFLPPRIDS